MLDNTKPDQKGKQIIQEKSVPKKEGLIFSKKLLKPLNIDPNTTMLDIP